MGGNGDAVTGGFVFGALVTGAGTGTAVVGKFVGAKVGRVVGGCVWPVAVGRPVDGENVGLKDGARVVGVEVGERVVATGQVVVSR